MDNKVMVSVVAKFDNDGQIRPLSFTWEDGREYEIDKIMDIRRAASLKAGGIGLRYQVRVRNHITFLYYVDNEGKWFMERR